jgi:hypothetical protein
MPSTSGTQGFPREAGPVSDDLADVLQDPLSVAVKHPGHVMRGPPRLDVLQAPLAGNRPRDFRLPYAVEIALSPRGPRHCVMPLNLALWSTLAAVTIGFDCQSPLPHYGLKRSSPDQGGPNPGKPGDQTPILGVIFG